MIQGFHAFSLVRTLQRGNLFATLCVTEFRAGINCISRGLIKLKFLYGIRIYFDYMFSKVKGSRFTETISPSSTIPSEKASILDKSVKN